jgi:hypothetical protein
MKGMVPGKATGEQMRWNQYARPVGDSWRVDETYIKGKGPMGLPVARGRVEPLIFF